MKLYKKGIHVYLKNDHDKKLIVKNTAKLYCEELLSTRLFNTLSIRIEVRKNMNTKAIAEEHNLATINGVMCCFLVNKGNPKEFLIQINGKMRLRKILSTLSHELIHVKQYAKGELKQRFWKTDKSFHYRWKGRHCGTFHTLDYDERPWENEAFDLGAKLIKKIKKKCS